MPQVWLILGKLVLGWMKSWNLFWVVCDSKLLAMTFGRFPGTWEGLPPQQTLLSEESFSIRSHLVNPVKASILPLTR